MNAEAIVARLKGARRSGNRWMARCPAHDDQKPSLSIAEGNGKILLHCFVGCTPEAICHALGITPADLFFDNGNTPHRKLNGKPRAGEKIVAHYDYRDEGGNAIYRMVRYHPKRFEAWQPDGKGGWIHNIRGITKRVLYRLPELLAAPADQPIVIFEGEKDCETACKFGIVATTNAFGANAEWVEEYTRSLENFHVILVPHNDEAGIKRVQRIAAALYGKTRSLRICEIPKKYKDVSDWAPFITEKGFLRKYLTDTAIDWKPINGHTGTEASGGEPIAQMAPENWKEMFDTREQFDAAPPLTFAIKDFLQSEAITAIAGLSGHGKTWVALSLVRALLFGPGMLWDYFEVPRRFDRVIYLIPESMRGPIKQRLQLMNLYDEIGKRLFVRTLNMGKAPDLHDPRLLVAVKRSAIVLDTGVRFMKVADEANAAEIAAGLSEDMMGLLRAEADSVVPLFHSPKGFRRESVMNLENMIRGSSEIGAVLATAWGIRQIDEKSNIIHVQNIKPRDFLPCGPFQIIGRPYIEQTGDFQMLKRPEECGTLSDEQPELNPHNTESHQTRIANIALMRSWIDAEPDISNVCIRQKFSSLGIHLGESTIRRYRQEIPAGEK